MNRLRKKRYAALLLLIIILLLFYKSTWLLRLIYPIHYRAEIEQASERYEVDPYLVAAIIRVETNYNPSVRSHKGAIGLMQIMPDTAHWIYEMEGFRDFKLEDLDRPEKNILVGVKYIDLLSKQFRSQTEVVAAYNAGQGNVLKWKQSDIWDGTLENVNRIPFYETRSYVSKVLYYYQKYVQLYSEKRSAGPAPLRDRPAASKAHQ